VSYFAAAVVRGPKGWTASELDLRGVADIEEVAERLRDVAVDAEISLLFIESDDQYLTILRLDEGEDLRIFASDATFADESRLGALLLGDVTEPALELDDVIVAADVDDDADVDSEPDVEAEAEAEPAAADAVPGVEPIGDADLLADLGMSAQRLRKLCTHDGMLPADVTAEVCQAIGAGDELEELREV
jgi:putative tRNA adenosine deaminase-associated protein